MTSKNKTNSLLEQILKWFLKFSMESEFKENIAGLASIKEDILYSLYVKWLRNIFILMELKLLVPQSSKTQIEFVSDSI